MSYEVGQKLYRYVTKHYARALVLSEVWYVVKTTPKGAWICPERHWEKFIADPDPDLEPLEQLAQVYEIPKWSMRWIPVNARFASVTPYKARSRMLARARSYVGHAERRAREAQARLEAAKQFCQTAENEGEDNG